MTSRTRIIAGTVAALFSLEYVVGKTIMAARGELGMPGHPAPPEATEQFTGDIATAQLGNAALGLVTLVLALAFAQRWGRRVPRPVLAVGAVLSVLSGIAGAFVVVASLTGLREDHGQWGLDSLALTVVPLGAWVVLAAHALEDVRVPPPLTRAAFVAGAACAAYGGLKLQWALGGEFLLRETPLPPGARQELLDREPGAVATHWASVALALIGVALAVAMVRVPRTPRLLVVHLPAVLGVLMLARAGWGITSDLIGDRSYATNWDLALWSPFFAIWGAAWVLAARARRHAPRPTEPEARRCASPVWSSASS
ncbi:DUF3995 domain-containing protein [Solirubrobacter taibaiensis]|nr:DUF3995 domain-containing protein [Solirubrobacter taibaiensis]